MTKYYVVPGTGSMKNAGTSLDKPWSTLQDVFGASKKFLPGDEILIARGHHGAVVVTGNYSSVSKSSLIGIRTRSGRVLPTKPPKKRSRTTAGAGSGAELDDEPLPEVVVDVTAEAPEVLFETLDQEVFTTTDPSPKAVADMRSTLEFGGDFFITIKPIDATHAPVCATLTLVAAARWRIIGLAVVPRLGAIAPGIPPASAAALAASGVKAPRGITLSSQAKEDVVQCVIESCALYSSQNTTGWTTAQWTAANNSGGIHVFGSDNVLLDCHALNGAGIYFNYHTNGCGAYGCTAENFSSDGMNIKGNNVTVQGCVIMGTHKVNSNHNDLCQGWGTSDVIFDDNRLVAYVSPTQPYLATDAQGLGAYDGWKERWSVTNNTVAVDHPIGIWLQGDVNCYVAHNTVTRCGAKAWNSRRPPSILLGASKSGAVKGGSTIANNLAEAIEVTAESKPALLVGNVTVTGTTLPTTVWVDRPSDMHLKRTATKARGAGSIDAVKGLAVFDADGVRRVAEPGAPPLPRPDAGAYQYTVAGEVKPPVALPRPVDNAIVVPGVGVNVVWTKADPVNEKCVEILADGGRVGKVRTGVTSWMVVGWPAPSPLPKYMVRTIAAVSV